MRIGLSHAMLLLAGALASHASAQATGPRAAERFTYPWTYRDHLNYVVVLVAKDSVPVRAYAVATGPVRCDTPLSTVPDSVFRRRAGDFWRGIGYSPYVPEQTASASLGEEFVIVSTSAGDFGSDLIFQRQGALVLGTTWVWSGTGTQLWPAEAMPAEVVDVSDSIAPAFRRVLPTTFRGDSLITHARSWRFMADLARRGPYDVTITGWAPTAGIGPPEGFRILLVSSRPRPKSCR